MSTSPPDVFDLPPRDPLPVSPQRIRRGLITASTLLATLYGVLALIANHAH